MRTFAAMQRRCASAAVGDSPRFGTARGRNLVGAGLKLSIVKHIARPCGGITAENAVGRGGTFTVQLPRTSS